MNAVATNTDTRPVLQAKDLVKHYGRVVALDRANLELYPGEVLGVIGDNGAGKSTLIKCFSGAVIPDNGKIYINDELVKLHSPGDSQAAGIETDRKAPIILPDYRREAVLERRLKILR